MEVVKPILILIALTMALYSITLTMKINTNVEKDHQNPTKDSTPINDMDLPLLPSKRINRFMAEDHVRNPRAADHCHKNQTICPATMGKNYSCCNNKCMDLSTDKHNCGACKNKCKFTQECCAGQCVEVAYDKRHCGQCYHRCDKGKYCVYGMCEYA